MEPNTNRTRNQIIIKKTEFLACATFYRQVTQKARAQANVDRARKRKVVYGYYIWRVLWSVVFIETFGKVCFGFGLNLKLRIETQN